MSEPHRLLAQGLLLTTLALTATLAGAENLSDPTRRPDAPAGSGSADASPWRLQSTRISARTRIAVIGGQTVREGERIELGGHRLRIHRIEAGRVELEIDGQRTALTMFDAVGKTPANLRGRQE